MEDKWVNSWTVLLWKLPPAYIDHIPELLAGSMEC
jgi:hypothetical protein